MTKKVSSTCTVPKPRAENKVFGQLTVWENLRLALMRSRDPGSDLETIFALYPQLRDKLAVKAGSLSGGEQQFLAFAQALAGGARMLLIDEPVECLAPHIVPRIKDAIQKMSREKAMIVVDHNMEFIFSCVRRVCILYRGAIVFDGAPSKANAEVFDKYVGVAVS